MAPGWFRRPLFLAAFALAVTASIAGQQKPAPPATPRIYIFDNGKITGLDPKLFGFSREEIKEPDFVNISYLIVHPKGTLMFDSGAVPDEAFKADGTPVTEGIVSATRMLRPQLAAAGYAPSNVQYFALSHYHSDHTANANAFAGSTWIVQRAERDAMFVEKPEGIIRPEHYSSLRKAKTKILDGEDLDVFGDGAVVIKHTPGHTPGHQALFVRLAKRGPVLLGGDMYHFPEELSIDRVPTFDWNVEQSKASRAKVTAFLKQTGAQLWIEHDIATHAKLPKAPAYVE